MVFIFYLLGYDEFISDFFSREWFGSIKNYLLVRNEEI